MEVSVGFADFHMQLALLFQILSHFHMKKLVDMDKFFLQKKC